MITFSQDRLGQLVQSIKTQALLHSLEGVSNQQISELSEIDGIEFDSKIKFCESLLELLDIQEILPDALKKSLWKLYSEISKYKALQRKEESWK